MLLTTWANNILIVWLQTIPLNPQEFTLCQNDSERYQFSYKETRWSNHVILHGYTTFSVLFLVWLYCRWMLRLRLKLVVVSLSFSEKDKNFHPQTPPQLIWKFVNTKCACMKASPIPLPRQSPMKRLPTTQLNSNSTREQVLQLNDATLTLTVVDLFRNDSTMIGYPSQLVIFF